MWSTNAELYMVPMIPFHKEEREKINDTSLTDKGFGAGIKLV